MQDLTDLIDKYAVNYKEQFAKLSKDEQEYINSRGTTDNGGFYGMPLYTGFDYMDHLQNVMYINKTWLDKVGKAANIKKETIARMDYTDEEMDERQKLQGLITSEVAAARDLFITGTKDPSDDTQWNAYLKSLDDLQLNDLMKLFQKVYDKNYK